MIRRTILTAVAAVLALGAFAVAPAAARASGSQPALNADPLTVTISGPNTVQANTYCRWEAVASGGTGPYLYVWSTKDGQQQAASSDNSFTWAFGEWGADFVYVEVIDQGDARATDGHGVFVSFSTISC